MDYALVQLGAHLVTTMPWVDESDLNEFGKPVCTRRMADWLDKLPNPTRRSWAPCHTPPLFDEEDDGGQFKERVKKAGLDNDDQLHTLPHQQHENPLRQHPIGPMELPMRPLVPQRRSSLNFSQKSSHQDLRTSAPVGPQLASPQTDILLLQRAVQQLGHPQQPTTTGLHLNYPRDIATRPMAVPRVPRRAPVLEPIYPPFRIARMRPSSPQVPFYQRSAHLGPQLRHTGPHTERKMENHNDGQGLDQDVKAADSQAQTPSSKAMRAATVHRQGRRQIQQLFGRDTAKQDESKKRHRSDTPATMAPPAKRVRRAISSARQRLSQVMAPANDAVAEGRQSRVDLLTEDTKSMSLSAQSHMIRVMDFAPGVVKETVKIAFLGNTGVGKTKLIQTFRHGLYEEQEITAGMYHVSDGYTVQTINVVLDGVPVALQTWDVASQCNDEQGAGNSIRPLLATFYDVVVICFDVSDEATLKAAESKWAPNAERYCTGAPTFLLGLKTDLRKPFPSLRLTHLREPTQTSTGQGEAAGKRMVVESCYEASAKTGEGVADFFESVLRFALQRRQRPRSASQGTAVSRVKKTLEGLKKGFKKSPA